MNNELKKTIDSLTRNKEKNIKTIEKYENSIKDLKKENKQIDNEINKLKVIAKKYESLDEQKFLMVMKKIKMKIMNNRNRATSIGISF